MVDADIRSYFDSILHDKLMEDIKGQVADGWVLDMIEGYLKQGVMDGLKQWEPDKGTPQGVVISPLLANIYLNEVDHEMSKMGYEMVRYADDFVILCTTEEEAKEALTEVKARIEERGLSLHLEKTQAVAVKGKGGFDFLGYHFEGDRRWPRKKSMDKLKETIRDKTKRTSGRSMQCIIEDINRSLRGWFEYFQHSNKKTFLKVDGWIRMRLRSILTDVPPPQNWNSDRYQIVNPYFDQIVATNKVLISTSSLDISILFVVSCTHYVCGLGKIETRRKGLYTASPP